MARKLGLANSPALATMRMVTVLGTIGLGIVTSSDVRAQTQPRGTQSAAAPLESTGDSSALLARAREKIARTTHQLLKCTCLETIERTYYAAPVEKSILGPRIITEAPANSCGGREFGKNGSLSLDARDRLRLGVTVAGGDEIYSWAAASRFDSRSVFQMVSSGPISTGSFGQYLVAVFENPGVRFKFRGTKVGTSGEVFEYGFEVPAEASHYEVAVGNGWKVTGTHGWFQINAVTADLLRLVVETEQLPPEARFCRARTSIDYRYMLIGTEEFLIPRQSELETLSADAGETSSVTTFSGCRQYAAESKLRFDGQESLNEVKVAPHPPAPLPPGVSLTLALLAPIDTSIAAAGDPVSAKVSKVVRAPHSNQILVPAGATAHGRILQVRHQYRSSQFLISIRFDTIETQGVVSPLSIKLDRELQAERGRTQNGLRQRGAEFSLPPPASGGTGSLFVVPAGGGRYVFPRGFESKWTTVAQ